eukprot:Pgem_evm1s10707
MTKRQKSWQEMTRKLKDPTFAISDTRLSVRNIPTNIDEIELRKLFNTHGKIAHIKDPVLKLNLFRDRERVDQNGKGRSLGFCFVGFKAPECALK